MRITIYRQLESSDCGPACIKMIASYYGKDYSFKVLRELCHQTRVGVSIRDVISCFEKIGFNALCVNVNHKELQRMPLPAMLYLKQGHFVVLEEVTNKKNGERYVIIDPGYGRVCLSQERLFENWMISNRGIAVVVSPSGKNVEFVELPKKKKNNVTTIIKQTIRKNHKNFCWIFFLTLAVLATNWAMPLLFGKTIDEGIMQKNLTLVWKLLLCQFFFFIGYIVADNITDLLTAKTSIKIKVDFISNYLRKVTKLPIGFFDTVFRSDLIQRINDQERLNNFITDNLIGMIFVVLNIAVFSVILVLQDPLIFILFFSFSIISIVYNLFFLKKRKYLDYSLFSAESNRRNTIYELIMGMSEIKINNAHETRISEWKKKEDKINQLRIESIYLNYFMANGSSLIDRLKTIVLTGLCSIYVIQDQITIGSMMMISYVLGQLSGPVNELIKFSRILQDANLSYRRLAEIYERADENHPSMKDVEQDFITGIQMRNVGFFYKGNGHKFALRHINIDIPCGKKIAIVGPSGSGKTTLMKLLLGFYYPTEGILNINGINIKSINLDSWRSHCGVVMQDGFIFSGSIAENIAISDSKPDFEHIKSVSQLALIADYVESLPMGYHTQIGETGLQLSGGEKQRLHIARALYKNPNFLFFDEATSSLDANSEYKITKSLDNFCKGKTMIVVAHRLSTVKNADHIIVMNQGEIVEQGTHKELIERYGFYYKLVKNQLELGN